MKRDDTPVIAADVADALTAWLVEQLPDHTIYQNDLPRGFKRPSAFVELIRVKSSPFSTGTTQEEALITATLFPVRDEFNDVDRVASRESVSKVVRQLTGGFLMVRDRAVKITSVSATPDTDRTFIDIQFKWIENWVLEGEKADIMNKLNLKLNERRD